MDDPSPQQPLRTGALPSSSARLLTCCYMDRESAGSSSSRQELNPGGLLLGTTLDLTSGSLRLQMHKQEPL